MGENGGLTPGSGGGREPLHNLFSDPFEISRPSPSAYEVIRKTVVPPCMCRMSLPPPPSDHNEPPHIWDLEERLLGPSQLWFLHCRQLEPKTLGILQILWFCEREPSEGSHQLLALAWQSLCFLKVWSHERFGHILRISFALISCAKLTWQAKLSQIPTCEIWRVAITL